MDVKMPFQMPWLPGAAFVRVIDSSLFSQFNKLHTSMQNWGLRQKFPFCLTLVLCWPIWHILIFELSEISVNLFFFFFFPWHFDFFSFRVMSMHARFQHTDVFCINTHNLYYVYDVHLSIWPEWFKELYRPK